MWAQLAPIILLHLIRWSCCSPNFAPIRRFHPTKLHTGHDDDLVTAENVEYAYAGGESHSGADLTEWGPHHVESNQQHGPYPDNQHSYLWPGTYRDHHHEHTGEVELGSEAEDSYSGYLYVRPPQQYFPPPTQPPAQPPALQAKQSPNHTYYYLGRHLWYIPLYFSIYFILYVGALVLKSVARHKILFPENLKEAATAQTRALRHLHQGTRNFYMR